MSVLIKGMEMPKSCDKCIYSAWSYFYLVYVCNAVKKNEPVLFDGKLNKSTAVARSARADNCPLVSVPPHGRLIDADAFIEQKIKQICENCDRRRGMKDGKLTKRFVYAIGDAPCRACDTGDMLDYVDEAPTVIEADE